MSSCHPSEPNMETILTGRLRGPLDVRFRIGSSIRSGHSPCQPVYSRFWEIATLPGYNLQVIVEGGPPRNGIHVQQTQPETDNVQLSEDDVAFLLSILRDPSQT